MRRSGRLAVSGADSQAVMMGRGGEIWGRGFDGFKASASPAGFAFALKKRIDRSDSLTLGLDRIRHSLILQEDSIIFGLLERAQNCYKPKTYDPDAFAMEGFNGSLVEFMLKETEKLQAQVGCYKTPDEHPFFPVDLPDPTLPTLQYPQVLHPFADSINIDVKVWQMYSASTASKRRQ